jgi:phosphatidylserine/phosphatidylglycerophosphate/cardiolipin synthase-like enzyme
MGLFPWTNFKHPITNKNNEEINLKALRKEIKDLRKENSILRGKNTLHSFKKIHLEFFDENIEDIIIENISEAKKELCIAMAWFTSYALMDELDKIKGRGVEIKVVISNEKKNLEEENESKLRKVCTELKIANLSKTDKRKYDGLMHNKYCIIDDERVIDGSYNWSRSNSFGNNEEHIIVIESKIVAKKFKNNFNKIYNNEEYYKSQT